MGEFVGEFLQGDQRIGMEDIRNQAQIFESGNFFRALADNIREALLVVTMSRQVVYANLAALRCALLDGTQALGLRPGEMLNCVNASLDPSGCGGSRPCSVCGAVSAIVTAQKSGKPCERECRITARCDSNPVYFDFLVGAVPISIAGTPFTLVNLTDISDTKRRRALERIFFHDIINTAGGLVGMIEYARVVKGQDQEAALDYLQGAAQGMVDEILSQKKLLEAESGELRPVLTRFLTADTLSSAIGRITHHPCARNRQVVMDRQCRNVEMTSDQSLVERVLVNMLKNGLEAVEEGMTVTSGVGASEEWVSFWVHNPGAVSAESAVQIFQRSFSTKGQGRGLGTYSMKLIGEGVLEGRVEFESSESEGTVFRFTCPRDRRPC